MSFAAYLLISLAILTSLQLLRTKYRDGLKSIPGPFTASFSNLWRVIAAHRGEVHIRSVAAHEKYGPVVRIGPNHVSLASPQAFSTIHASRQAFAKSDFYEVGAPSYRGGPLENLFSIRDVNYHAVLRKNIGGLYTKTAVKDFEPQIDSCIELFLQRFKEFTKNGSTTLNMSLWLHLYAYDCLGEVNVSKKLGFMERGSDVGGMIAAADKIFWMVGLLTQAPGLHFILNVLRGLVPAEKAEPLLVFTFDEVDKRRQTSEMPNDMLTKMLSLRESQPDKVSIREITAAIFINLMAGHDVLAITLRAVWYYLARNPSVVDKLRAEIRAASKDLPENQLISYDTVSKLPYLDAIFQETLRVHPNTGTIIERKVPTGGAAIDGYWLPGDTIVGVNAWVLHRDKHIFGEDVDVFRPERWLEASEEQRLDMNRHIFTFGAGTHTCIGKNIAAMQATKLIAEFYRRFDAQLAHPEREWKVHGSWVTKQTDMDMVIDRYTAASA